MRRRSLLAVTAAAFALGVLVWMFASLQQQSSPPGVARPALTPSDAVTSPPFARGASTVPTPVVPPGLDELKRQYFSLHDRAARFALLKDRPEPEAQYLAYRAFHECGRVMSNLRDGNDFAYNMRRFWAEQDVPDRTAREVALERWSSACAGFLRPNPDVRREAEALLKQAVSAGHVGAQALTFDFADEVDKGSTSALARSIVESGDPLTMFDGYAVMLKARRDCGAGESAADDNVAWILATCRFSDCYRTDLFFSESMCAMQGACDQKAVERLYLNETGRGADRERLLRRVDELERLMREGRKQDLLPCPGP
jgi:hypothetical protein